MKNSQKIGPAEEQAGCVDESDGARECKNSHGHKGQITVVAVLLGLRPDGREQRGSFSIGSGWLLFCSRAPVLLDLVRQLARRGGRTFSSGRVVVFDNMRLIVSLFQLRRRTVLLDC